MALVATIPNCYEELAGASTSNSLMIFMHSVLNTAPEFSIIKQAGATAGEDLFLAAITHADYSDRFACVRVGDLIYINYDPTGTIDIDVGTGVISGASSTASGNSNGSSLLTDRNGRVEVFDAGLVANSLSMGTQFYASVTDTQVGFKIKDSTGNFFYWLFDIGRVGARRTPMTDSEKHGVGFLAGQLRFWSSTGEYICSTDTRSRIYIGNGFWRRPIANPTSLNPQMFTDVGNYTSPVAVDMFIADVSGVTDAPWGQFTHYHWIDQTSRFAKNQKYSVSTNQSVLWLNYNSTGVKYGCLWNYTCKP